MGRLRLLVAMALVCCAAIPAAAENGGTSAPAPPAAATTKSGTAPAQPMIEVSYRELPTRAEVANRCELFMLDLVQGDYNEAFAGLRPFFPISNERFQRMEDEARKQHAAAELQFGKPLGHILVREELVKDTVLKLVYLEKFEWDALVWEFTFYKPGDGWILNGLKFDDGFQSLFQ